MLVFGSVLPGQAEPLLVLSCRNIKLLRKGNGISAVYLAVEVQQLDRVKPSSAAV